MILEDAAPFIRQLQDTELKETKWSQKCGEDDMKAPLVLAVMKNRTQIKKALNILSKVNAGDPATRGNSAGMRLLVTLVDQIKQSHEFNGGWTVTYGLAGRR